MDNKPPTTLANFAGRWRLTRQIDDRRAGLMGRFEGVATFTWADTKLAYLETGTLHYGPHPPVEGSRSYTWHPDLSVTFPDGRPFHTVPIQGGTAHHACPPDSYTVHYTFTDWPHWTAIWTVNGPRKDHTLTTTYTRE